MLPVADMSVKKHQTCFYIEEELEKSEGRIRAKRQPYILSYISPCNQSVHRRTEIDMAVFEAPL